jgi:predicted  nucleic acid-binding Zn-ribbon protein
MVTEKSEAAIEDLHQKVDELSAGLASLREELEVLNSVSEIDKKIDTIGKNVEMVCDSKEHQDLDKKLDDLAKTLKGMDNTKKLDDLAKSVTGIDSGVKEVIDSKESAVIIKKIDDILVSIADGDGVPKKLDDLQNYIAGLSGIEEKVQDLAGQFEETKEIVGIIVRQLDDIERKYNQAIDRVTEVVDTLSDFMKSGAAESSGSAKPPKQPIPDTTEEEKPKVRPPSKGSLPSTIDALMDNLMTLVVPQTEAAEMAEALEEVRDELTTMIKGHTPVLFQFGKRSRELKSYPPTATLNENDIASLSREIKSWKSKLKEMASSS